MLGIWNSAASGGQHASALVHYLFLEKRSGGRCIPASFASTELAAFPRAKQSSKDQTFNNPNPPK